MSNSSRAGNVKQTKVLIKASEAAKIKSKIPILIKGKQSAIADDVTELRISLDKITVDCSTSEKPVEVKEVLATTDGALSKPGVDLALPRTVVKDVVAQGVICDLSTQSFMSFVSINNIFDL